MDPEETRAVPFCPSNSTTGREATAPRGYHLRPRRGRRRRAHCHNHGITDQAKDEEHSSLFEACEGHKDALFSEKPTVLPDQSALKRKHRHLKRHLPRGLIRSRATSPKAHGPVKKGACQGGVSSLSFPSSVIYQVLVGSGDLGRSKRPMTLPSGEENIMAQLEAHPCATAWGGKLPGDSADRSYPKIFVSILDSSSLEDATDNFSFQGFPEAPCTDQEGSRAPKASDQASVPASEWQQKLEAAEALLSLRLSPSPSWLHFGVPSLHHTSSSC